MMADFFKIAMVYSLILTKNAPNVPFVAKSGANLPFGIQLRAIREKVCI